MECPRYKWGMRSSLAPHSKQTTTSSWEIIDGHKSTAFNLEPEYSVDLGRELTFRQHYKDVSLLTHPLVNAVLVEVAEESVHRDISKWYNIGQTRNEICVPQEFSSEEEEWLVAAVVVTVCSVCECEVAVGCVSCRVVDVVWWWTLVDVVALVVDEEEK
ncbi:hypothetical protein Tco_1492955 [Tanacetum coccineum]